MTGPCAKTRVICVIVTTAGERIRGENSCENPQPACPRTPGEGYAKCASICRQGGHAEIAALAAAGDRVRGGVAYLHGHTYACQACQEALFGAGIKFLSVTKGLDGLT